MCRPISPPILSKRARRETPTLGSINSRASVPRTKSALTAFLDLNPVSIESIEDLPAPPMDDVLFVLLLSINVLRGINGWIAPFCRDLRLTLDSATGARVRPFLQSVLVPPIRQQSLDCFEDTPSVSEFLKQDSPLRSLPSLDSPPLFPRIAQGRCTHKGAGSDAKSSVSNPIRVSDLAPMLHVASPELIDGEDGDINNHHNMVVSGWGGFRLPEWI